MKFKPDISRLTGLQ